jgi:hypothetical protein
MGAWCYFHDLGVNKSTHVIFCQPIKYVLFGFAKRTGLFGPIGHSTYSNLKWKDLSLFA